MQPITGFRLSAIGGPQVEIRSERVVSYGIRRCEFDEYLLRRSGARLREGDDAHFDRARRMEAG